MGTLATTSGSEITPLGYPHLLAVLTIKMSGILTFQHINRTSLVCLCMCVCVCVYTYIYIHTYTYTYIHIYTYIHTVQFSSVHLLSHVRLFATSWTAARQASLSITNSPGAYSNSCHQVSDAIQLSHPLMSFLLPPSIFPSIRVFPNESVLRIRWPKYWSFSFSISPSNEYSGLISFRMTAWISLQSKGLSRVFSNTTVQKYPFFGAQLSLYSNSHIHT